METDVVVVGAGHAGIEAAYSAAKRGTRVLVITSHLDFIGHMSCNPSIGGIAKGTIVREIDALGGCMGRLIDDTGIHFKMLNTSKGCAVWGNRAQADKRAYRFAARHMLERKKNIFLHQGMAVAIREKGGRVCGVILDSGEVVDAEAVILANGTFLNGVIHIGLNSSVGGRTGEAPSLQLTESITSFGIRSGRLKTGTSPRIDGRTIDLSKFEPQPGDKNPWPFSFSTTATLQNTAQCWISRTTPETHKIIRDNLERSPLFTGKITSSGPRYCPSIEDKVVRFGDRTGHSLFLEPEGNTCTEFYCNGLSTSLPLDVQYGMVHSIPGMENAAIVRPGYGIEYDYFPPEQLRATLESKMVGGLFFAGQINGTSGYEEAACQGLIAGINAAEYVFRGEELILSREEAYIGVLIDDLVTKGTEEPYRMFTSRAEYRLLLRQDNADERLMTIAAQRKLIQPEVYNRRRKVWERKKSLKNEISNLQIESAEWNTRYPEKKIKGKTNAAILLKRPRVSIDEIALFGLPSENRDCLLGVEADIKYEGFVQKQKTGIERTKAMDGFCIPSTLHFDDVQGLLLESRKKLQKIRPETLGQASRIPGVTPADVTALMKYCIQKKRKGNHNKNSHSHVSRETVTL